MDTVRFSLGVFRLMLNVLDRLHSILGRIRLFSGIDHIDTFYLVFHIPRGNSRKTRHTP